MGALTQDSPKCLTKLAGRALLDWQIQALRGAGVNRIAVVRGYLAERIERPGLHYFHNPRWANTNMVFSLICAKEWLQNYSCIVSYADIVYSASAVSALMAIKGDLALTYDQNWLSLWSRRFADPLDDAETFRVGPDGFLAEIGGKAKSLAEIHGQYMGLLRFTPCAWEQVEAALADIHPGRRDLLDMTSMLSLLIKCGVNIRPIAVDGPWYEVDSEQDLALYEELTHQHGGIWST